MPLRQPQDNLPYRVPATASPAADNHTTQDEQDFNTLKKVEVILESCVEGLYKEFNAFNVTTADDPKVAAANLLVEIKSKQFAYEILVPALEMVKNAIKAVDDKYKEG